MGIDKDKLFSGVFKDKRVLITGDTGFKGSWLAMWLTEMGAKVFGYALPPRTPLDNYPRCDMGGRIHHLDGDVCNAKKLMEYFHKVEPDIAFHLAAQAIVLESYERPQYTFETNIMGAVNFFEAVRNTPSVEVAVNITSDKCYQNREWVWVYRENDPMGGNDPYSASKGCSELITHSYLQSFFSSESACHIASARAGNVIGGGDWAPYRIVPDFFRAVKEKRKLMIRSPEAVRPWQHVLEPLSGYLLLATMLWKEGNSFSGGWNFGPVETNNSSVRELIEAIIRKTERGAYDVAVVENAPPEAKLLRLDVSKSNSLLKWCPALNFEETVAFTSEGYMIELDEKADIYSERLAQLEQYIQIACDRNLSWTKSGK